MKRYTLPPLSDTSLSIITTKRTTFSILRNSLFYCMFDNKNRTFQHIIRSIGLEVSVKAPNAVTITNVSENKACTSVLHSHEGRIRSCCTFKLSVMTSADC